MGDDFERGGSKLYASLSRSLADDPVVAAVVGEHKPLWEAPLRLFGGVHYLELSGVVQHPWPKLRGVLEANRDWLARFVAEHPVQTNEVQRCWGLLPGFLKVADKRPVDLIELGPSAGLNLFWDRYRYRYGERRWGPASAALELTGEAEGGPPPDLLRTEVTVRRRMGIDRHPVDVTTEHGARLLEAFVWADQTERLERVRRAVEIVRSDPPRLMQGDFVEVLPPLLARRDLDALTVVYDSASTIYLAEEDRSQLEETMEQEGRRGALAWVSFEFTRDQGIGYEGFVLDVRSWPGGAKRLAHLDGHANHMEWVA
jgi:hypothetical protein